MYDEVPTNTATLEGGRDQVTGGSWYPEVDLVIIAEAWRSTVTWSDSDKYAEAGNLNYEQDDIFIPTTGVSDEVLAGIRNTTTFFRPLIL